MTIHKPFFIQDHVIYIIGTIKFAKAVVTIQWLLKSWGLPKLVSAYSPNSHMCIVPSVRISSGVITPRGQNLTQCTADKFIFSYLPYLAHRCGWLTSLLAATVWHGQSLLILSQCLLCSLSHVTWACLQQLSAAYLWHGHALITDSLLAAIIWHEHGTLSRVLFFLH